uniref:Arm DNA-binding domain-containing protein n=1 Tax=Escherichia coli TaxID=562 RepID=UPI003985374E
MKLNARQIDTAKPKEKAYKLADGGGLYLLVKPGGGEYWRLKYRVAGKQNFRSHSLYAGAEVGYRYHLTDTTFVEPQAELVWGRL